MYTHKFHSLSFFLSKSRRSSKTLSSKHSNSKTSLPGCVLVVEDDSEKDVGDDEDEDGEEIAAAAELSGRPCSLGKLRMARAPLIEKAALS